MLKRIAFLTGIGIAGMAMGIGIVYARWHPVAGVDYPYDSANYYSLTTISVPDSAPSTFALRDLASAGGTVIDVTRLAKSVIFGEKYVQMLENKITKNENTKINIMPLSEGNLQKTMEVMGGLNMKNKNLARDIDRTGNGKFANSLSSPDGEGDISKLSQREQLQWLSKTYTDLAQSAKESDAQINELLKATEAMVKMSAEAEGEQQARQSGTALEGVKIAAIQQFTQTMNTLVKLRAAKELKTNSDTNIYNAYEAGKNTSVADPYDTATYETLRQTLGLERKERPKEFPKFSQQ